MNRSLSKFRFSILAMCLLAIGVFVTTAAPAGATPVFTSLYSFSPKSTTPPYSNSDGAEPLYGALVQGSDGNFYGTTNQGGSSGKGTVFMLKPDGPITVLHSFSALSGRINVDGANPYGGLIQGSDGNFYGTTGEGGSSGYGTVFRMTPSGTLTTLVSFNYANGGGPTAALVEGSDGNFYGTTKGGGASGNGTVFRLTPTGALTTLVSFNGTNGQYPEAGVIQGADGNFYGTTGGGGTSSNGTVFKITPSGTFTTVVSFSYAGGALPTAALVLGNDGDFYGTTVEGGLNGTGAVYKVTPAGAFTTVYSFSSEDGSLHNADGAFPVAGLIAGRDGDFYGTAQLGGSSGFGTVFKVTPTGNLTTLKSFTQLDGASPAAGLIRASDGNFYGTTLSGGPNGTGTLFTIEAQSHVLYTFPALSGGRNSDGAVPQFSGLVQGSDGSFYGTAFDGGPLGNGTAFKATTSGTFTKLVDFTGSGGPYLGAFPTGGLTLGSDGNFYGTTYQGGTSKAGTVYRLTPSKQFTTLVNFTGTGGLHPGATPLGRLIQDRDGNFYGTTDAGGPSNDGTVFKMTPAGVITTLANFRGANGKNPWAGLTEASDGNFYGSTYGGGAFGYGTVFQVTTSGALTTLVNFNNANGANPQGILVQGLDGNFYGTAFQGGSSNLGTVFKMSPTGTLTTLVNFDSINGDNPTGGLIVGPDGSFYGTTAGGGSLGHGMIGSGTVFKMTPSGALTSIVIFRGADAAFPGDTLALGNDGSFYGTAAGGGASDTGALFRVDGPPVGYGSSVGTSENTPRTFTVAFDDPSGLGIDSVNFPAGTVHGTLTVGTISETGTTGTVTLTYTPAPSYFGKDSFTYTVIGATGTSAPQTVAVTVSGASGLLTGSSVLTTTATSVNLSTPGTADWAHFARGGYTDFDHKINGGTITNDTVVGSGSVSIDSNDLLTCAWTDGTPTVSGGSKSSVQVSGLGDGFQITASADTATRTLTVYVGGADSGGKLVANLSDESAPDFVQTRSVTSGAYDVAYTLTYHAASSGQKLYVKWTQASGTGTVSLGAATLR